jgi:diacylglycerol kinase (ATP)
MPVDPPLRFSKAVAIVNPAADGGRAGSRWGRWETPFRNWIGSLQVLSTRRPGEEPDLVREALESRPEAVIGVGGDGTLRGIAEGIVRHRISADCDPALVPFPLGSGSDYARTLGLAGTAQEVFLRLRNRATLSRVDVGWVELREGASRRDRLWLNQSYVGFGARVVRRVNRPRGLLPKSYARGALRELFHARPLLVRIRDGDLEGPPKRITTLLVANGQYSGGGMWTCPPADPSDGALDVEVIDALSRWHLALQLGQFRRGRHLSHPAVHLSRASTLAVEGLSSSEEPVEADGEILGSLPARYRIEPRALPVARVRPPSGIKVPAA